MSSLIQDLLAWLPPRLRSFYQAAADLDELRRKKQDTRLASALAALASSRTDPDWFFDYEPQLFGRLASSTRCCQPHQQVAWLAVYALTVYRSGSRYHLTQYVASISSAYGSHLVEPLLHLLETDKRTRVEVFELLAKHGPDAWGDTLPEAAAAVISEGISDAASSVRVAATKLASQYPDVLAPLLGKRLSQVRGNKQRQHLEAALASLSASGPAKEAARPEASKPKQKKKQRSWKGDNQATSLRRSAGGPEAFPTQSPTRGALPPGLRQALGAARKALQHADGPAALEALLACWRQRRSARIATLVERLARSLPSEPIRADSKAEVEARWGEAARRRDSSELGTLLATPWPKKWRDGLKRLKALKGWEDPRVATAMIELLEVPPYSSYITASSRTFWAECCRLIAALRDPRTKPRFDAQKTTGQLTGYAKLFDGSQLNKALAQDHRRELSDTEQRTCAEIESLLDKTAGSKDFVDEATLLAQIYAEPANDAARLVYGDLLTERGDPRGELIALQQHGDPTPAARRRISALLKAHQEQWLGPLAPWIRRDGRRFARGFLQACAVEISRPIDEILDHPSWATVEEIALFDDKSVDITERVVRFLCQPVLRSLEAVHGLDEAWMTALTKLERPCGFSELSTSFLSYRGAVPSASAFPSLERFGVYTGEWADRLVGTELWNRLVAMTIGAPATHLGRWLEHAARHPGKLERLRLVGTSSPFVHQPRCWRLTLSRDSSGRRLSVLDAEWFADRWGNVDELPQALSHLDPAALSAIAIHPSRVLKRNASFQQEMRDVVRRFTALDAVDFFWD